MARSTPGGGPVTGAVRVTAGRVARPGKPAVRVHPPGGGRRTTLGT